MDVPQPPTGLWLHNSWWHGIGEDLASNHIAVEIKAGRCTCTEKGPGSGSYWIAHQLATGNQAFRSFIVGHDVSRRKTFCWHIHCWYPIDILWRATLGFRPHKERAMGNHGHWRSAKHQESHGSPKQGSTQHSCNYLHCHEWHTRRESVIGILDTDGLCKSWLSGDRETI